MTNAKSESAPAPRTGKKPQESLLPGQPGNKNGGRPKGALNKENKALREMILEALDGVGGVDYLQRRANDPKTAAAFLSLIGKVLPTTLASDPTAPFTFTLVRRVVRPEDKADDLL